MVDAATKLYYSYKPSPSQDYGAPRPGGQSPTHRGIDYAHGRGSAVPALLGGSVVAVYPEGHWYTTGYGNRLEVFTPGVGIVSYSHLNSVATWRVGDPVTQGETVGTESDTGWTVGYCMHLEWQRTKNGTKIDPGPLVQSVINPPKPATTSTPKPTTTNNKGEDDEMLIFIQGKEGKRRGGVYLLKDGSAVFLGADGGIAPKNMTVLDDEATIKSLAKHYKGIPV